MSDSGPEIQSATDAGPADAGEPIDVDFREAEPPRAARGGPGWASLLIVSVITALSGGALGYGGAALFPQPAGPADQDAAAFDASSLATVAALASETRARSNLEAELSRVAAGLEARLTRAEERLSAPPVLIEAGPDTEALAALEARVAAMEALPSAGGELADSAELARALASAGARIDTLETRLGGLSEQVAASEGARAETIAQLAADVAALRTELDAASRAAASRATSSAEAALALSTMDAAARRGQPFAPSLATLRQLRPGLRGLDELEPFAATGAPTLPELVSRFAQEAEAARQVLAAGQPQTGAVALAERLFGDAVQVRRESDAEALDALGEAEAALARSDLGGAIEAVERLEGPPADALLGWLIQARARRTLERSLDVMRLDLMSEDP